MEDLISVIVPVYNAEAFLHRSVGSVLKQCYRHWELLLVDDGSKDKSGLICDELASKDERIRVFHTVNQGAACARFYGVQQAKGELVCFMDADDSMPCDALSVLYGYYSKYQVDIVVGGYRKVYEEGATYDRSLSFQKLTGQEYLFSLMSGNWKLYGPWAKLMKKSLFTIQYPKISEQIKVGEDLLMNVYLSTQARTVVFIPEVVYDYHLVETSASCTHKYTVGYMRQYLEELEKILCGNIGERYKELITHYKLSVMQNIMIDDSNADYDSPYIRSIITDARNIRLSRKECVITWLIRYRILRLLYRFWAVDCNAVRVRIARLLKKG